MLRLDRATCDRRRCRPRRSPSGRSPELAATRSRSGARYGVGSGKTAATRIGRAPRPFESRRSQPSASRRVAAAPRRSRRRANVATWVAPGSSRSARAVRRARDPARRMRRHARDVTGGLCAGACPVVVARTRRASARYASAACVGLAGIDRRRRCRHATRAPPRRPRARVRRPRSAARATRSWHSRWSSRRRCDACPACTR